MELSKKNYHRGDIIEENLGAVLLESKFADGEGNYLVLALLPKRREYATWWMDKHGCTFQGHYFLFIEDALKDFEKRGKA